MSKFKRLNLSEAMKLFPLMNEEAQQALKGGCELCEQFPGQIYSFDEYERLDKAGDWTGGMVCGMGYVGPTINIWGDMDYCFEHGEYVEDNNCMKCYYGSLEFCMEHECYFDGLNECEECIIEGYEEAALYAAYTYYEDYFESGDNNEDVDDKGETDNSGNENQNTEIVNTGNNTPHNNGNGQNNYDVNAVIEHLNQNAQPASVGRCAAYVRQALEAGGIDTTNRPSYACNYGPFLETQGFFAVDNSDYQPEIGDIVVFSSFGTHRYGHIQMYNGENWVSDFVQRDFWPGQAYRTEQPAYMIYRR